MHQNHSNILEIPQVLQSVLHPISDLLCFSWKILAFDNLREERICPVIYGSLHTKVNGSSLTHFSICSGSSLHSQNPYIAQHAEDVHEIYVIIKQYIYFYLVPSQCYCKTPPIPLLFIVGYLNPMRLVKSQFGFLTLPFSLENIQHAHNQVK